MREIGQRRGDPRDGFVREMRLLDGDGSEDLGYAAGVPAVAALRDGLQLDPRVTFLVGESPAMPGSTRLRHRRRS